ncbi:hypothetical protein LQZ21_04475 [Treponema sp. TIM-1]|uniref:hypothetical protein n=1 Tax=Treponema sp. TIM-1 TaxID=2898417 RepID=UPI003980F1FD
MLKKYMIFGSAVLLLAALLTLTGCSQATDSDGGSTVTFGENYLYGASDADDVNIAVRAAQLGNRNVVLGEALRLNGGTPITPPLSPVGDFKDRPVRVEYPVTVENMIINAVNATLTFLPSSSITLGTNAIFIYRGDPNDKFILVSGGHKVQYVENPLYGTQGTDQRIAVSNYTIGADFSDVHEAVTYLYVLDKLTINAGSTAVPGTGTNPTVIALGEVDLAASNTLVFQNLTNFQFTTSATLTSTTPGVILNLPASANLPTIEAPVPINIAGPSGADIASITIKEIKGPGTVTISPANGQNIDALKIDAVSESGDVVVNTTQLGTTTIGGTAAGTSISLTASDDTTGLTDPIKITGNNAGTIAITVPGTDGITQAVTVGSNTGTIEFDTKIINLVTTAPPDSDDPSISITNNTGSVIFKDNLTLEGTGGGQILRVPNNAAGGTIRFEGRFTSSNALGDPLPANAFANIAGAGTVEFMGPVEFNLDTNIDCPVVFNDNVTLAHDQTLGLGGDVTLAYSITSPPNRGITLKYGTYTRFRLKGGKKLLVGNSEVLAAGTIGATITAPQNSINTTLIAGVLDLENDEDLGYKTLIVDGGLTSIDGELRILGTGLLQSNIPIPVAVTGALVLEEDSLLVLPGTGSVTLGDTTITGRTISLTDDARFTAEGGEVILRQNNITGRGSTLLVPEDVASPTITVAAEKNLFLRGADLDLQYAGTLTLTGHASTPGSVILEGGTYPGKITLSEDAGSRYPGNLNGLLIKVGISGANDATIIGTGELWGDDVEIPCVIGELSGGSNRLTIRGKISAGTNIVAGLSVDD